MTERILTREEQMLAYFVSRCDRQLGRTQLMRFIYLTDYEARRYLGHPLSDLDYVWHTYGPWNFDVQKILEALVRDEIVREEEIRYPNGKRGFLYH